MEMDLKTLLLCNLSSPTTESYRNLSQFGFRKNGTAYFTLGGVDAISVYPTPQVSARNIAEKASGSGSWLESVLQDKKRVIDRIDEAITYHPIHLVRYTQEKPSSHINDKRFLLVTFVYGISESFRDDLRTQTNWTVLSQQKPSNMLHDSESAEPVVSRFSSANYTTDMRCDGVGTEFNSLSIHDVEIFDCINISDRVILTYTNDIIAVLDAICHLETDGKARKTYTMVNFRLSEDGIIDSDVHREIARRLNHKDLSICIRGSIHDNEIWNTCCEEIDKTVGNKSSYFINYGEADFTISVPSITGEEVSAILKYYQEHSEKISVACWDIHTELQLFSKPTGSSSTQPPKKLLHALYQDLNNNLAMIANAHDDWSWVHSLKELFSAHVNIERNPVLHGPSYLLWDSFRIFNDYFSTYNNKDNKGPIGDIEIIDRLLVESRDSLERGIRCLSQLTDQLTRNDDIIFRGIGRIPAIATTLPENLLEFYQAFLREIAELLVNIDHKKHYKPVNYHYGFLIAPEFNQRARISQVFNTKHEYRKKPREFQSWPSEQIHIIQLPINDIFCPAQCMIPLAHECFHFFGDYLRFRRKRAWAISIFLANIYVDAFAFDAAISKRSRTALARALAIYFMDGLKENTSESPDEASLYLTDLEDYLIQRCKQFLSEEGIKQLYNNALTYRIPSDYLYYLENIRKRTNFEANFDSGMETNPSDILTPRKLLFYCSYYFKECYADFMSIVSLGLHSAEYLQLFISELPNSRDTDWGRFSSEKIPERKSLLTQVRVTIICQRIAIVLTALLESNRLSCAEYENALDKLFNISGSSGLYRMIDNSVNALRNPNGNPLDSHLPGVFPIASLRTVVDYLLAVSNEIRNNDLELTFISLREKYDKLIRNEKIFEYDIGRNTKGNDIIYKNRKRVMKEVEGLFPGSK